MAELTVIFTLLSAVWIFTVPLYAEKLVSNATVPRAPTSGNDTITIHVGKLMKHGYNASYRDTKLVGGHNALVGECPYQVSLRRRVGSESTYGHFCGGSIISIRHVLTAARCLIGQNIRNIYVTVGSNDLLSMPQQRSVIKWIIHGRYNKDTMENDIAIIEVDHDFQFYNLVSAIQIAPKQKLKAGTECDVSGWGIKDKMSHMIPNYLQVVRIPFYDREDCDLHYATYLTPGMICGGPELGGQGPCKGDSGGPMVCNGYLTGIVPWGGGGCGKPYNPAVFTDVAHFASFIDSYTLGVEFATVAPESASPASAHHFRATWLNIIIIITVFLYYFK